MATYAKCGWIFNNHFTVNLQRNLNSREKNENRLRFSRIMAMSLWSHFFWPTLCVCLRLSQVSETVETAKRIELGFGIGAFFDISYTVLHGNLGTFKNKGTSLWNFVPNSGLRKFRHGKSIVLSTKLIGGRRFV